MKILLSFIAILLLVTSNVPIGFADTTPQINSSLNDELPLQPSTLTRKTISIDLEENIGIASGSPTKKEINNITQYVDTVDSSNKLILLNEDLQLFTTHSNQKIHFDTIIVQPQTIVERISQSDKLRDDRKKNSKIEMLYIDDTYQQNSQDNFNLIGSSISQKTFLVDPLQIISDYNINKHLENVLQSVDLLIDSPLDIISDSFILDFNSSFDLDVNFVLLIFTPLLFFLFIFSEDVKFKIEKIRPILSCVFILILLSTIVVTPYSISSSYWPQAFAETIDLNSDNQTASADNTSSSSTPAEDTVTVEATTSDNTDTTVDSASSSSTPAEDTESTKVSSSTNTTASANNTSSSSTPAEDTETAEATTSNQTSINDSVTNSTTTSTNSTGIDIPVHGTIPGTNSTGTETNLPIILPNSTESWSFDTQVNGSRFIGDVYIEETDSSLILEGEGYLSNDGNSTSNITDLSVTAWVNPDYSGGSAEFTVIGKEKAFALTINNNIEPKHIATFSVFDGIKWHTVQTADKIGDDWSHIAATFNGTTLSIYTNGTHSNTNESIEKITLTIEGQLEVKTIETIESTSDVVIGASLDNNRSLDDITKQFFGEIKEVNIFNVYLTAQQIKEIYLQTLPLILELENNTTTEIIKEEKEVEVIDVLSQTNSTNIIPINNTATDIILTNNTDNIIEFNGTQEYISVEDAKLNEELNKLTISTWINPDYTSGSAEFSVVSKENSFILGINNIYSPEKTSTFAIFDGITWTKIIGETQITDWSHLVAVINGTEISLYLNGNLESQITIPESFVILEGEMSPVSAEIAENDSDLIIGAYLNTLRGTSTLSNHFSGSIDDVLIYKEALSQAQINEIYASYVTPSEDQVIPFESYLLSFSDTITVFLNNEIVSQTVHVAPIDIESTTPSVVQSLSFADYVSYKVNGQANDSSVEIMILSDTVVATIIPADDSLVEAITFTDTVVATIIPADDSLVEAFTFTDTVVVTNPIDSMTLKGYETLSFNDVVIPTLNDVSFVGLLEILSLDVSCIHQVITQHQLMITLLIYN